MIQLKFVEIQWWNQYFQRQELPCAFVVSLAWVYYLRGSFPLEILHTGDASATYVITPHLWIYSQKTSELILSIRLKSNQVVRRRKVQNK